MTTKGMTLNDITTSAADFRAVRAHLALVLATVDQPDGNADALQVNRLLTYLDTEADRLDAAAMLAVDEELGDLYWSAYDAAEWGPLHLTGIRAVRERLALVAEWLIAEARWEDRIGSKDWTTRAGTQDDYALSESPAVADATPRVWDDIVDVPHNVRVADRYGTEWRWDGAWEWLSVIGTGGWIIAGFSERTAFAPFTEVI